MNRVKRPVCLAAALWVIACAGCMQARTKAILNDSEQLIDTSKEVLALMQSVRDAPTAQAALPKLKEKYPLLFTMVRDVADRAKAVDRAGGGTREGAETFKKHMMSFQTIAQKIGAETDRVRAIRGIPIEFWNFVRIEAVKGLVTLSEIQTGQIPSDVAEFIRSIGTMMEEFGPERVVLIEAPGTAPGRVTEIASQLQAKLGPSAKVAQIASDGEASISIGPVEDFDKFVETIDFGTVTDKDPAQRVIHVDVSAPRVAARPSSNLPGRDAGENDPVFVPPRRPSFGATRPRARESNSYEDLVGRYGKERVVRFEITNQPEIVGVLNQTIGAIGDAVPEIRACELTGSKGQAAPVKDFNAFCGGLSFAEIVERNDAENFVKIKVDPSKVAALASVGARRMAERIGGPNREEIEKLLERNLPAGFGDEKQMPEPNDPEYHKKLSELMVASTNHFESEKAIDALLTIPPEDIKDKEVRKKIARNFRELATKERLGPDRGKAIRGLVKYGGKFSVPILIELLEREKLGATPEIFDGLADFPDPRGAEAVSRKLGDPFNHDAAVNALREMGEVAEDALIKAAPSDAPQISLAAVKLLGDAGTQKSVVLLGKAAKSPNPEVAEAAKSSLKAVRERVKKPVAK